MPLPVNVAPVKSSVAPSSMRKTVAESASENVPESLFAVVPADTILTPPVTVVVSSAVNVAPFVRTIVSAMRTGLISGHEPIPYVDMPLLVAPFGAELGMNDLSAPNLMPHPPSIVTLRMFRLP